MSWKYGTILHDTVYRRKMMVLHEIPVESAGEKGLYEAIDLADDGSGELHAISPKDAGIAEIATVRFSHDTTTSGTWTGGTLEIEPAPLAGQSFTITYEER